MKLEYVLIIALVAWAVLAGVALMGEAVADAFEATNAGFGPGVQAGGGDAAKAR